METSLQRDGIVFPNHESEDKQHRIPTSAVNIPKEKNLFHFKLYSKHELLI